MAETEPSPRSRLRDRCFGRPVRRGPRSLFQGCGSRGRARGPSLGSQVLFALWKGCPCPRGSRAAGASGEEESLGLRREAGRGSRGAGSTSGCGSGREEGQVAAPRLPPPQRSATGSGSGTDPRTDARTTPRPASRAPSSGAQRSAYREKAPTQTWFVRGASSGAPLSTHTPRAGPIRHAERPRERRRRTEGRARGLRGFQSLPRART